MLSGIIYIRIMILSDIAQCGGKDTLPKNAVLVNTVLGIGSRDLLGDERLNNTKDFSQMQIKYR